MPSGASRWRCPSWWTTSRSSAAWPPRQSAWTRCLRVWAALCCAATGCPLVLLLLPGECGHVLPPAVQPAAEEGLPAVPAALKAKDELGPRIQRLLDQQPCLRLDGVTLSTPGGRQVLAQVKACAGCAARTSAGIARAEPGG